jgi:hypothetical protein
MYDETTIALVIHCWQHIPVHYKNQKYAINAFFELFVNVHLEAPPDTVEKAVQAISVDVIALYLKQLFLDPHLVNEALKKELHALQGFCQVQHS